MILGIMADTHRVGEEVIRQIVDDLIKRDAEIIIHSGDLEPCHMKADLFGGLPVVLALSRTQHPMLNGDFVFPPSQWHLTRPVVLDPTRMVIQDPLLRQAMEQMGLVMQDDSVQAVIEHINIANRLVDLGALKAYVGHERSHDVLNDKARFNEFLQRINQVCGGVSLICTGHTHHKFLVQRDHINWINPGAVMVMPSTVVPGDGYDYALYNSANNEVVFCRIPVVSGIHEPVTVGIIADTDNISQLDESYWRQLAREFHERGTQSIIMCGNHWGGDIGRSEFDGFEVYFNMLPHQTDVSRYPSNWHRIDPNFPVVDVMGFKLMVQYDFGDGLSKETEVSSLQAAKELSRLHQNHHIDFVLCGQSQDALLEDGEGIIILCPGDSRNRRKFATVCLPRKEITFGAVRIPVPTEQ